MIKIEFHINFNKTQFILQNYKWWYNKICIFQLFTAANEVPANLSS